MSSSSLLAKSALWYAQNGIPVFPCVPKTKRPLTEHGFKDATNDVAQVKEWWAQWPNANMAMPTGKASGRVAPDVDPRYGGNESLEVLIARHGRWKDTAEQITGRGDGGRHIVFSCPEAPLPSCELAPGIDLKAEGGYIMLAPSIHPDSGKPYVWDGISGKKALLAPAECPGWIIELAKQKKRKVPRDIPQDVPEGARNDTLFSLACSLRARGFDEERIFEHLKLENSHYTNPLDDEELRRIAHSAAQYPPGQQRQADAGQPETDEVVAEVSLDRLNSLAVFRGKAHFRKVQRKGSMLVAEAEEGIRPVIWYSIADVFKFASSQQVLGAAGLFIPSPPSRKKTLWWEQAARLLLALAEQDADATEADLPEEFAGVLRMAWDRADCPVAADTAAFVSLLRQCGSHKREPRGEAPKCSVWIAENTCWVHLRTLLDWLSTPVAMGRNYPYRDAKNALLLLGFQRQDDVTRSHENMIGKASLFRGPQKVLLD